MTSRSILSGWSAASDVYNRQVIGFGEHRPYVYVVWETSLQNRVSKHSEDRAGISFWWLPLLTSANQNVEEQDWYFDSGDDHC